MITERTLKKWRREALKSIESSHVRMNVSGKELAPGEYQAIMVTDIELSKRILRLTQILLDQHLMKGK